MKATIGMVSLGCSKNQIDGEMMLGTLQEAGYVIKDDAALADVVIVNTCGFIESAKHEAIEEILELGKIKKEGKIRKIIVTGCLAERYQQKIHEELPEVDAVLGIGANADIVRHIEAMETDGFTGCYPSKDDLPLNGPRMLLNPSYFAYIKIAEGCSNCCTYCAIPSIRGSYRSRDMDSIVEEAEQLAENGAKEIILVAQDTSRYGQDLYGEYALSTLLKRLCAVEKLQWIRVLYCYPEAITDDLLETMAAEEKVVKYLDIPLQHISDGVLKRMNRRGDREYITALFEKIRKTVPGIILRTTFITGFPGETKEDFTELAEFVKEMRFDRMGCFAYSQEEGTPAAAFTDQIDEDVKNRRAEILTDQQMNIMMEKAEQYVGEEFTVLVEGFDRYAECYFGRSYMDAPEIDGKIFFAKPEKRPALGSMVQVEITECYETDLFGEMVE